MSTKFQSASACKIIDKYDADVIETLVYQWSMCVSEMSSDKYKFWILKAYRNVTYIFFP